MRKVISDFLRIYSLMNCFFLLLFLAFTANGNVVPFLEVNSENKIAQITKGHYLIVGSFLFQKNAQSYTRILNDRYHDVMMAFYPKNQHYYVYLYESKDVTDLRSKRDKIRRIDDFKDAWILSVGESKATAIKGNNEVVIYEEKAVSSPVVETKNSNVAPKAIEVEAAKVGMKSYPVYVNVTSNNAIYKEVRANLQLVFNGDDKVSDLIESHQPKLVQVPVDGPQEAQLICDVFGYKKVAQDINFIQPINENTQSYTQLSSDTIIVNIDLVRYKKGDIFTMFNVFFYNDAAVMLPKSMFELNSLVDMVKENPKLNIKLHGHTNGNDHGRIIRLAPNDNDYFNIKPSNIQGKGSAKDLSFARADIIRRYLMEQGIDAGRIEYKGWGGAKPIYPSNGPDAQKNVRVEVEILKD